MKVIYTNNKGVTVQSGKKFIHFKNGQIEEVPDELGERLLTKSTGFAKYVYDSETKPKQGRGRNCKNKGQEEE